MHRSSSALVIAAVLSLVATAVGAQTFLSEMAYNIAPSTPVEHQRLFREHERSFEEIGKRLGLTDR